MTPVDEETLKLAVEERLALLAKENNGGGTGSLSAAKRAPPERWHTSKGYVTPVHTIRSAQQVTGKIIDLTFDEGKQVKAGDVLAMLEKTEYQSYYDNAAAKAEAAKALAVSFWKYRAGRGRAGAGRPRGLEGPDDPAQGEVRSAPSSSGGSNSASQEDYEQAYFAYLSRESITDRLDLAYKLLVEPARAIRRSRQPRPTTSRPRPTSSRRNGSSTTAVVRPAR